MKGWSVHACGPLCTREAWSVQLMHTLEYARACAAAAHKVSAPPAFTTAQRNLLVGARRHFVRGARGLVHPRVAATGTVGRSRVPRRYRYALAGTNRSLSAKGHLHPPRHRPPPAPPEIKSNQIKSNTFSALSVQTVPGSDLIPPDVVAQHPSRYKYNRVCTELQRSSSSAGTEARPSSLLVPQSS
eukprot:6440-Rhodomonas_salina.1